MRCLQFQKHSYLNTLVMENVKWKGTACSSPRKEQGDSFMYVSILNWTL